MRTYFSPRFTYNRVKITTSATSELFPTLPTSTSRTSTYDIEGNFGAEGRISDKFSAFGEVGFGYSHGSISRSSSSSFPRSEFDGWGTREGVGVIFYF